MEDPQLKFSLPAFFNTSFVIEPGVRIAESKRIQLAQDYILQTDKEILFDIQVCSEAADVCATRPVVVKFPFNAHQPQFLPPTPVEGSIRDMYRCDPADPQPAACQVDLTPGYRCTDGDGDILRFSVSRLNDGNLFAFYDSSDLSSLYYRGAGFPENTSVILIIEAEEVRPAILNDGHLAISVVRLDVTAPTTTTESSDTPSPTSPTPPPPPGQCNDIYFILTIVLASVLGVTLILIICTPIILKFCRKSRVGKMTGPLSRKATTKKAGVLMSGASFKSFSDMNYATLQESPTQTPPPPPGLEHLTVKPNGRVRTRVEAKLSQSSEDSSESVK